MKTKILKLNYSKWRSGGDGENKTGTGETKLGHSNGQMCVLGQFSLQIDKKMNYSCILDKGAPCGLAGTIPGLSTMENGKVTDTPLAIQAMTINDDEETTPAQKISKFRKIFKKHGYKIKVTHRPKK